MSAQTNSKQLDMAKVQSLQAQILSDLAATVGIACADIGDRLGLFKALASLGPSTAEELAAKTQTYPRYVQEWLINQSAGGYVSYDTKAEKFFLSAEQAAVLAEEGGKFFSAGGIQSFMAMLRSQAHIAECFRSGEGMTWGEHDANLFAGTERFFRTPYLTELVQNWLPSVPGLIERLQRGAHVADVGCGHGISTAVMAKAFPQSQFYGFDLHAPSIESAKQNAQEAGVAANTHFVAAPADKLPRADFDVVCYFDCLHDMGDPAGVCREAARVLKPDGMMFVIEPMAGKTIEENFNPVGRAYSGCSVLCCTPNAVATGGKGLGTVATDKALESVALEGGFKKFWRATATPLNRVFAATK